MANGIIVIDKPQGWTASGIARLERDTTDAMSLIPAVVPSFSRQTRSAGLCRDTYTKE